MSKQNFLGNTKAYVDFSEPFSLQAARLASSNDHVKATQMAKERSRCGHKCILMKGWLLILSSDVSIILDYPINLCVVSIYPSSIF